MQIEWIFDLVSICEIESHRIYIRMNVAPSDKSHECLLRFCRARWRLSVASKCICDNFPAEHWFRLVQLQRLLLLPRYCCCYRCTIDQMWLFSHWQRVRPILNRLHVRVNVWHRDWTEVSDAELRACNVRCRHLWFCNWPCREASEPLWRLV